MPPKPGEPAVRAKSNSISEQLANPDVAKAKLISRMAKMGQPMLPFLAGTAGTQLDSSDSEIEDPNTLRGTAQPVSSSPKRPFLQPAHAVLPQLTTQVPQPSVSGLQVPSAALMPATLQPHSALPGSAQSFQPYAEMAYAYSQTAAASQLQPVGQMYPSPFQAPSDVTSFLMTEARQHNTEIRMAVSKVADKMDHLAAKVEELQKQNTSNNLLLPGISSVTMETAMIMSNIQRIIQENERLKQEIFEKSSRIEEQNEKIGELIERNQRYVEQSNLLMEQRNNSLQTTNEHTQARVLHAEQEKHTLPVDRGWDQYSALQSHVAALKARYEERIRELEKGSVLENQERSPPADSTEEVKKIMNGVFQTLRGEFELEESYSGRTVLGVVMNTIKTVTLQLLSRQQERRDSNSDEEEAEPRTGKRKQESPPKAKEDHEGAVQYGPAPSTVCPTKPAGESAGIATPPRSPEEGQRTQNTTASEVKVIQEMHEAHTFSESVQPVKPNQGLVDPEEDVDSVLAEQRQASAPSGLAQHEGSSQKIASVQAETPEPSILDTKLGAMEEALPSETPATEHKAEEPAGRLEPLPLKSAEGGSCLGIPDAPRFEMGTSISDLTSEMAEKDPATNHETTEPQGLASSPKQKDSSLTENDDDLFKVATHKPLKPGVPPEEEDEEEVSMKGHPPPAPLFGDDDDDDDLDWLG
ncbi:FK506-binding protein 15 [Terrapene carolina triunguis]|uniref:FK506-binding protein 15 n=1 Tax=Terrapene triunguis TaxID=2587831 RepID=UPI0011564D91|nr:FK506-binding protein 15 [Terrapene carolina triunguis]